MRDGGRDAIVERHRDDIAEAGKDAGGTRRNKWL